MESSDIDMVVILDTLSMKDVESYRDMLDTLEHRELVCGFLSGREELLCWEPSDLFQFCHDTTPILGSLEPVLEKVDADAVDRAIRIGICNIYHGCVHNMLFERDGAVLKGFYKAATFVIRAEVFRRTGQFHRRLQELNNLADEEERRIIWGYVRMAEKNVTDFKDMSEMLFSWSQKKIVCQKPHIA